MTAIDQEPARRPGRPKREEVTQTERRRRKGPTGAKLAVPAEIREKYPDMDFRWGRDDGDRMQRLTQADDWDKVPEVAPIHAGRGPSGAAMQQHLLMKPKKFMEQDRAEKVARLNEMEKAQLARPEAREAIERGAELYSVPGNKI